MIFVLLFSRRFIDVLVRNDGQQHGNTASIFVTVQRWGRCNHECERQLCEACVPAADSNSKVPRAGLCTNNAAMTRLPGFAIARVGFSLESLKKSIRISRCDEGSPPVAPRTARQAGPCQSVFRVPEDNLPAHEARQSRLSETRQSACPGA